MTTDFRLSAYFSGTSWDPERSRKSAFANCKLSNLGLIIIVIISGPLGTDADTKLSILMGTHLRLIPLIPPGPELPSPLSILIVTYPLVSDYLSRLASL